MDKPIKYAIIIDSFRSHNSLAWLCYENKIAPIHIFSSQYNFEKFFSCVNAGLFAGCYLFDNYENLAKKLEQYKDNILFCFACSEETQHIKTNLDELLNLPNKNPIEFAPIRENKFKLYQFLNQPSADQNFSNFVKEHGNSIIKPAPIELSAGCQNVQFVDTTNIDDKENFFISKYFEGDEYAVDLVSCKGKHKLCAVWQYVRDKNQKIWKNKVELLHYDQNKQLIDQIYFQCKEWLDRLNHQYGPVHLEIKKNKDDMFCIEINFRLNGHMSFKALAHCFGLNQNQVSLTLNAYTATDQFDHNLIEYKCRGYISRIYFCNETPRKHDDIPWQSIENSPSVSQMFKHVRPWEDVLISNETYQTTAAIIIMFNQNYEQLQKDEIILRNLFV